MNMMKKTVFGLTIAVVVFGVVALAGCGGRGNPAADFRWQANESGGVTVIGYAGQSQTAKIPAKIEGRRVTAIAAGAFRDKELNSASIPDGVTSIGGYAFYNNYLTSVTIPGSLATVEDGVFSRNPITDVVMPAAFTRFPELGFPGSFDTFYEDNGKKAGTYSRPSASSDNWTYQPGKRVGTAVKKAAASQKALQGTWVCVETRPVAEQLDGLTLRFQDGAVLAGKDEDSLEPGIAAMNGDAITIEGVSFTHTVKGKTLTLSEKAGGRDRMLIFQKK
jgi:hypothetical protein